MKSIAAIDLIDSQVVRLVKGKIENKTVYSNDPIETAKKWESQGVDALHVVDLDLALNTGKNNTNLIFKIIDAINIPVQVAGGIRSINTINKILDKNSLTRVVLGTIAFKDPDILKKISKKKLLRTIVAIDHNNGNIMISGWKEYSGLKLFDAIELFRKLSIDNFLLTNIDKDGTLEGPDIDTLIKISNNYKDINIISSGGISSIIDIIKLRNTNCEAVILGKALYDNQITINQGTKSDLNMPLAKRIIPCLDVNKGRVVKGVNFLELKDAGNPVELAKRYSDEGADELVFLDITAAEEHREIMKNIVKNVASVINIPFTVGGGIKNLDDARNILLSGADRVSINTAAVINPELIQELMTIFGRQCIVVALDVKRNYDKEGENYFTRDGKNYWFEIKTYGGKRSTKIDAIEWAKKVEKLGAGEILLTSIDMDGTENGYDIELNNAICKEINIPVIASGGCGSQKDILNVFKETQVDAALAASLFHFGKARLHDVKEYLLKNKIQIRS